MRPLTIDLEELAFALDTNGIDHYLDLGSGKVLLIPTEDPDPELAALLLEDPERLLYIEPLGAGDSLTLMRDFLHDVSDPHAFTSLDNALAGRKPFKAFRHVLMGYPELLQRWYDYQAERLRDCALDWLALNHIQPSPGVRL